MLGDRRRYAVFASLALACVFATLSTSLALMRTDPVPASPSRPMVLSVEIRPIVLQESFTLRRTFSGQVQAGRQSELGFESNGRLTRVLVDEGATVAAGQLLAQLDSGRLEAQRHELIAAQAESEANLALADVTLARLRGIVDKGGVSQQGLDEARETQRAAKAALLLARQRIATIGIELDKTRLLAPFSATVIIRSADEGQVLSASQPVLTLQERNTPEIRIGIAGRSLDQLKPGQSYPATWNQKPIRLRLRALLPVREATARTVDALFDPLDPPQEMLAGDLVTLSLNSPIPQRGSWLPLSALAEGERGLWSLYAAEPLAMASRDSEATHRIVRHTVEILHQTGDRVYVRGALQPGQPIVTTGLQRIVPGQQVRLAHTGEDET